MLTIISNVCLIIAILILLANIDYKNHCIDDLELSKANLNRRLEYEKYEILLKIRDYTEPRKAYKMMDIRDFCNNELEKIFIGNKEELSHTNECKR